MTTTRFRLLATSTVVSLVVASLFLLPAASAAPGTTTRVSEHSNGTEGNGHSAYPAISADGQVVAFASAASTLVDGDTNGFIDIFRHDTRTHETTLVSVNPQGKPGNADSGVDPGPPFNGVAAAISADGCVVAFQSAASDLVEGRWTPTASRTSSSATARRRRPRG
jgi:hypothetical protein